MKRIIFIAVVINCSYCLYGQQPDSIPKRHFPQHYFSINPINSFALDQLGLNYEYKHGILGFGLTAGYKYAGNRNYSRFFISGTTQYGSFEFYKGFFLIPQVNLYFPKSKNSKRSTLCYMDLRCAYKYLHMDSTNWINFGGTGDQPFYRKQIDNASIISPYLMFGVKAVYGHFFIDFNVGPGWVFVEQSMIVAGEAEYHPYQYPHARVHNEYLSRNHFTFTVNLSLGGAF